MNTLNESADIRQSTDDQARPRQDNGLEMAHLQGSQAEYQEHNRTITSEIPREADYDSDARARDKLALQAVLYKMSKFWNNEIISPNDNTSVNKQMQQVLTMAEQSSSDVRNHKSLLDILKDCIPTESPLAYSTRQLSRNAASTVTISRGGHIAHHLHASQHVLSEIVESNPTEKIVLIIHNIDSDWCEALCSRFPNPMHRLFLLEHIFRFTLPLFLTNLDDMINEMFDKVFTRDKTSESSPRTPDERGWMINLDETSDDLLSNLNLLLKEGKLDDIDLAMELSLIRDQLERRKQTPGFHIHCWRISDSQFSSNRLGFDQQEILKAWRSEGGINGSVSCCRLADNLYLALTSDNPYQDTIPDSSKHLCVAHVFGSPTVLVIPNQDRSVREAVADLIQQDWSLFAWKCAAKTSNPAKTESEVDGVVLTTLLVTRMLKSQVDDAETQMRELAYSIDAEDDAERFERLTTFRRILGENYHALDKMRSAFEHDARIVGPIVRVDKDIPVDDAAHADGISTGLTLNDPTPIEFAGAHLDSLLALQKRIDAIREDLNEEIQVVIGAVQVRDAQEMKKQTKETVRLANVTVALAILAAIYLPTTLVTGIFGMNVSEISKTEKAPRAWWVVVIWLVVAFLTFVGGSLIWRANVKEPDVESGTRNRNASGNQASKTRNKWRNFRKEAANFRRFKTE